MVRCPRRKWPDLGQWPWGVREEERTQGLAIWGDTSWDGPWHLGWCWGQSRSWGCHMGQQAGEQDRALTPTWVGRWTWASGLRWGVSFWLKQGGESAARASLEF